MSGEAVIVPVDAKGDERAMQQRDAAERRRLEELVRTVPGVVWEAWGQPDAAQQRIDFVSEHVERMLGYSRAEWLATPNFWLSIVHPDDREAAARAAAAHFASGEGGTLRFRWMRKDGTSLWVQAWNTVIKDEKGAPVGMRGVTLDVTERVRAEESMRVSDERFHLVARATNDTIWDWNLLTNEVWWNENFTAMFGYERHEIGTHAESWTDRIHPEDLPRVKASISAAIQRGDRMWQDEYRFRHKSGAYRHILDRGFIIRDAAGKSVRMLGSMMDVTARRSTEEELHRVKHHLELILNSAGEGVYGVDATGITTFINDAGLKMLGLTREEAIGVRLHPVIHHTHPDGRPHPAPECPIYKAAHGGPGATVKADVFWHKDGTAVPVEYVTAPLHEGGKVVGAVTVFKDVTELRRSERELQRVKKNLELILNSAGEGVYGVDATGITTFINDAGLKMLGLTREEAIGVRLHPVIHHTHPDGRPHPAPECPIYKAAHGAPGASVKDDVFWRKDGTPVPVEYVVEPLVESGRVVGAVTVFKDITERRKAEAALDASRSALAKAQEIARLGSWTVDMRSGLIEYSDEMRRIHGVPPGVPITAEIAGNVVHPDDRAGLAAQVNAVLEGRGSGALEYRTKWADGTVRHIEARADVERDANGVPIRLVGTSLDVTERKAAQEELRYRSELVRTITDNAGSALFMMDARGYPVFLNDAAKAMTGYASIDEINDRPLHEAVHFRKPDGSPYPMEECPIDRANAEIRALKDQRETFCRKDGTLFPVEYNVAPIVRDGKTQGVVIEVRDITARLRAEEELRRRTIMLAWQRRVLETAARGAPLHETLDVLCAEARAHAPDHHFTVLLADLREERLRHGAAPSLPDDYNRAVDGIPIGEGIGSCGTAAHRKEPVIVTDIATDPLWKDFKGLALPIGLKACWSTPIFGLDGRLLGTWAVYRETPGAPEPQDAELVAIATRLAAIVIERAQAEEQLRQRAEELARLTDALSRSNKELDQFAYITSHDLKAPLRGIANLSRWIEEDSKEQLSEDSRQHLELLRGRVNRMESLIDAVLQYSRVGRVKARPEVVDTHLLVKDTIDLLAPPAGFTVEIEGELPVVVAERMRLQQVFMNLIGNAVKHHHDKAHGLVKIHAVDEGAKWRFTVRDNGPGIAPRFHEKVFVIFQTLEARDRVEGTGIGLALVKKIVESNGGTVTLDSDVGRGASFSFTWPKNMEAA